MTRKLHNTLMAAITSGSLLVVGVIASAPVAPGAGPDSAAGVMASIEADSQPIERFAAPARPVRPIRGRPSLMPFFSFAPRG